MKNQLLVTSLLGGTLFAAGCKPTAEKATMPTTAMVMQQGDKAQAATMDAAKDMQDYAYAQKAQFVSSMKAQLAELNRTVQELSTKVEKSSDAIKEEARPKIVALRVQAEQMKLQLDAAQNATETSWNGAKAETRKIYVAMKDGFAETRQWLAEKIAP